MTIIKDKDHKKWCEWFNSQDISKYLELLERHYAQEQERVDSGEIDPEEAEPAIDINTLNIPKKHLNDFKKLKDFEAQMIF